MSGLKCSGLGLPQTLMLEGNPNDIAENLLQIMSQGFDSKGFSDPHMFTCYPLEPINTFVQVVGREDLSWGARPRGHATTRFQEGFSEGSRDRFREGF